MSSANPKYKIVQSNIKLCPNTDINYEIYNREILGLIKNQNFCEFRFKNTPFEDRRNMLKYEIINNSTIVKPNTETEKSSIIQKQLNGVRDSS